MAQSQANDVYAGFEAHSYEAWKAQVLKEVKGQETFEQLLKTSPEGITTKPYYTPDDLAGEEYSPLTKTRSGWKITERIIVSHPADAFAKAQTALQKGADEVLFIVANGEHINGLLPLPANTSVWLKDWLNVAGRAPHTRLYADELMLAAQKGELNDAGQILEAANYSPLVDAAVYHNAGAETATQLAVALAHANEYLGAGVKPPVFNFAVGSNYFFEIAKLRAARKLYALISKQYNASDETVIWCETALNNKTIYDYNNNILRATTEAMAAVIGGCDTMYVHPYDVLFKQPNDFSARIARNVQLVLKHESYMDKVQDAGAGSFYIETLTQEIAAKAWQQFQNIEARGGWIACMQNGYLQKTIEQQAAYTQKQVDEGQTTVLGVNKYPNKNEKMKGEIETVSLPQNEFFPLRRFAEKAEQERLDNE